MSSNKSLLLNLIVSILAVILTHYYPTMLWIILFAYILFVIQLILILRKNLPILRARIQELGSDEENFREKIIDFDWKKEGF